MVTSTPAPPDGSGSTAPTPRYERLSSIEEQVAAIDTLIDLAKLSIRVFDVYRGEQIGEGNKSLALRLEFRSPDRTLTDEEVAGLREQIKDALARETGGTLRE